MLIGVKMDKYSEMTFQKVKRMLKTYEEYKYVCLKKLSAEIYIPKTMTNELPDNSLFKPVCENQIWGDDGVGYAYFKASFKVDKSMAGRPVYLKSYAGESEGLLFVNGKPSGMTDFSEEVSEKGKERLHKVAMICENPKENDNIEIIFEAYGGHNVPGLQPFDVSPITVIYPANRERVYKGLYVVAVRDTVFEFLNKLRVVIQLYENLNDNDSIKGISLNAITELFEVVDQIPYDKSIEEIELQLKAGIGILDKVLNYKQEYSDSGAAVGLIGHSHLDTAWLWSKKETLHKAARTFSNAISLLNRYDEYKFIQSSVIYLEWMEKYYPDIFKQISEKISEGRWEPNGGSYVECDGNLTGGEYLIRQFLIGQNYLQEKFGYKADTFWQPDTFGFSPAIPQIMLGCGLKYFLTTKLSWNEYNEFPYDTFWWQGIDGSKVFSHLNLIECWPDVETVVKTQNKKTLTVNRKLISYGFGDGGGGPVEEMVESAKLIKDLRDMPYAEHTTVSKFMRDLESIGGKNSPEYKGELYLEMHRGTLTQKHDIKRSNRLFEIAIHNLELISSHLSIKDGREYCSEIKPTLRTLLLNQFHDILPGTCLEEVNNQAISENYASVEKIGDLISGMLDNDSKNQISLYNTTSFRRNDVSVIDGNFRFNDYKCQNYKDLFGNSKTAVSDIFIEPFSSKNLFITNSHDDDASRFIYSDNILNTPIYTVKFGDNGEIVGLFDKEAEREIVDKNSEGINRFIIGEDLPYCWENWNVDYDQKYKMNDCAKMLEETVVSDGTVEFRIRRKYKVGKQTNILQDIVFYSDNRRIDFETLIDWNEKNSLLKTVLPIDVFAPFVRYETQFGYVIRENNENTPYEKTKFEVCNHKWTDLSENRYGVAVLNDCKYGISVDGKTIGLTLHRGGTRPDQSGDKGEHYCRYALLPHIGGFSAETVIKPAYEFNYLPVVTSGANNLTTSLFKTDKPNIIIETVKRAENENGFIVRLYESECNMTNFKLKTGFSLKKAYLDDMLENNLSELEIVDNTVSLKANPFEIITLRFELYE